MCLNKGTAALRLWGAASDVMALIAVAATASKCQSNKFLPLFLTFKACLWTLSCCAPTKRGDRARALLART
jgi:hypothetical protein